MRRVPFLAVALCAVLAPAAQAGTPFTVGEGRDPHLAIGPGDVAHIVWRDETRRIFHCRLPRGRADCQPLNTIDAGTDAAAPYALIGAGGAGLYLLMPHYVEDRTYMWQSSDDGMTWGPRQTIYSHGGGTGSSEPVLGPQPGQVTFAAFNPNTTIWSAALDGSESGATARATLSGMGGYDVQVAPTTDGGLVAVANDLDDAFFSRMAPGGDPSDSASWSGATLIGEGDTTRVAGGSSGTFLLSTFGPANPRQDIRPWTGSGFGPPVSANERGYINDIHVGPSGAVAAIWRLNDPSGNRLRMALRTGAGNVALRTIAIEDSVMAGMDVALAPDDVGLTVYEGEGGSSGARQLIRVANTNPVVENVVPPDPPSVLRRSGRVPGATLRLVTTGNCVDAGDAIPARVTARRRGRRFAGIRRVDFLLGNERAATDRKKPFAKQVSLRRAVSGQSYRLRARVRYKLRGRRGLATKTLSATIRTCPRG
ncbi:MAG TPA: hypothetical protein VHF89_20555 [Solirubrobacteraceae bacterium]|nr:hypothetical protein [Solirubrobacteraceae bacterium]